MSVQKDEGQGVRKDCDFGCRLRGEVLVRIGKHIACYTKLASLSNDPQAGELGRREWSYQLGRTVVPSSSVSWLTSHGSGTQIAGNISVYHSSSWRCSWFENSAWNPWGRLHRRGRHRDTGGGPAPCRRPLTGEARRAASLGPATQASMLTPIRALGITRHSPYEGTVHHPNQD